MNFEKKHIFYLDKQENVYTVEKGQLDIYAVKLSGKLPESKFYKLGFLKEGESALSYDCVDNSYSLIAVADMVSSIKKTKISDMSVQKKAAVYENWVKLILKIKNIQNLLNCRNLAYVVPNKSYMFIESSYIKSNTLSWISTEAVDMGKNEFKFWNFKDLKTTLIPVYNNFLVKIQPKTSVKIMDTEYVVKNFCESLSELCRYFVKNIDKLVDLIHNEENKYIKQNIDTVANSREMLLRNVSNSVFNKEYLALQHNTEDNIFETLQYLAHKLGMSTFEMNGVNINNFGTIDDYIENLANSNGVFVRRIKLEKEWWKKGGCSFVGFDKNNNRAYPVIYRNHRYYLVDISTGAMKTINKEFNNLRIEGYTFHAVFPDTEATFKDIVKTVFNQSKLIIVMLVIVSVIFALIAMAIPVFTQYIITFGIVYSNSRLVLSISVLMLVVIITSSIFIFLKNILIIRFEAISNLNLQNAVISRLLRMNYSFFKKFSSGDLADRVLGIETIQNVITGSQLNFILTTCFSMGSLLIMFYYSWTLSLIAVLFMSISFLCSLYFGLKQFKYIKNATNFNGEIDSFTCQLIKGFAKLKIMNLESIAFEKWSCKFNSYVQNKFRSSLLNRNEFLSDYTLMNSAKILIFFSVAFLLKGNIEVAYFMAFIAAFAQFYVAATTISKLIHPILYSSALYKRLSPLLKEKVNVKYKNINFLEDINISINDISFRYTDNTPMILKNLSMNIEHGKFIAIVGASGSGKSTIIKVLLGLEEQQNGSIFINGVDIKQMDLRYFRKRIGVVSQNSKLIQGSILENITAGTNCTQEKAWEAAKMAGVDAEINSLPMKMHTVISEGSGTISNGMKQRIIIARALIRKPKLLILDEATSALDNVTQDIISKNLEKLQVTRVVIAHRLSTVVNADKIYVINNGCVAEEGTYKELMANKSDFCELVGAQLVS